LVSNKSNSWLSEDKKFYRLESKAKIPSLTLQNVPNIKLKKLSDFDEIPNTGGCYWIWTNERVHHRLHRRKTPNGFNNGEIIYNGLAKDNIQGRIKQHLLSDFDAGWSGISIDIYTKKSPSHRKRAMSNKDRVKVPYLADGQRINSIKLILKLNLSSDEKKFIKKNKNDEFFFRNGINIFEKKHKSNDFRIYYITNLMSLSYAEFIEKKWRERHGSPKLCSYISGR